MKREAQFGKLFRHWLRANPQVSGAFELKQTTSEALAFDSVKEHQIDALLAAHSDYGITYKIPDDAMGVKPFDYVYLRNAPAWVAILYPGEFYIISITAFLEEKKRSERKSLLRDRARKIAAYRVQLSKLLQNENH